MPLEKDEYEQAGEDCGSSQPHRHVAPFEDRGVKTGKHQQRCQEEHDAGGEPDKVERLDSFGDSPSTPQKVVEDIGGHSQDQAGSRAKHDEQDAGREKRGDDRGKGLLKKIGQRLGGIGGHFRVVGP